MISIQEARDQLVAELGDAVTWVEIQPSAIWMRLGRGVDRSTRIRVIVAPGSDGRGTQVFERNSLTEAMNACLTAWRRRADGNDQRVEATPEPAPA